MTRVVCFSLIGTLSRIQIREWKCGDWRTITRFQSVAIQQNVDGRPLSNEFIYKMSFLQANAENIPHRFVFNRDETDVQFTSSRADQRKQKERAVMYTPIAQ